MQQQLTIIPSNVCPSLARRPRLYRRPSSSASLILPHSLLLTHSLTRLLYRSLTPFPSALPPPLLSLPLQTALSHPLTTERRSLLTHTHFQSEQETKLSSAAETIARMEAYVAKEKKWERMDEIVSRAGHCG